MRDCLQPIDVCVFTSHFHPHTGGVERFNQTLWPIFVKQGWHVALITCQTAEGLPSDSYEGIKVNRIRSINLLGGQWPVPFPKDVSRAISFVKSQNHSFSCFVTNTRFYPLSFFAAKLSQKWQVPYVHIEHGSSYKVSTSQAINLCCFLFDLLFGSYVVKRATVCTAVSSAASEYCRHLGAVEVELVYNAIDTSRFINAKPSKAEWGIEESDFVFLFASRLIEPKGIKDFLTAAVKCSLQNAKFFVAGSGPLEPYVRSICARDNRIRYLGDVPSHKMPSLFKSVDVLCHPSFCSEGLPTVILEAGASSCAVVATKAGGTVDIISNESEGLFIEPRAPHELGHMMRYLAENADARIKLGVNLQRRVCTLFDIFQVANKVYGIIDRAVTMYRRKR